MQDKIVRTNDLSFSPEWEFCKQIIDELKTNKIITTDEWYKLIISFRSIFHLPIAK
jgi:hypothetical protein